MIWDFGVRFRRPTASQGALFDVLLGRRGPRDGREVHCEISSCQGVLTTLRLTASAFVWAAELADAVSLSQRGQKLPPPIRRRPARDQGEDQRPSLFSLGAAGGMTLEGSGHICSCRLAPLSCERGASERLIVMRASRPVGRRRERKGVRRWTLTRRASIPTGARARAAEIHDNHAIGLLHAVTAAKIARILCEGGERSAVAPWLFCCSVCSEDLRISSCVKKVPHAAKQSESCQSLG